MVVHFEITAVYFAYERVKPLLLQVGQSQCFIGIELQDTVEVKLPKGSDESLRSCKKLDPASCLSNQVISARKGAQRIAVGDGHVARG